MCRAGFLKGKARVLLTYAQTEVRVLRGGQGIARALDFHIAVAEMTILPPRTQVGGDEKDPPRVRVLRVFLIFLACNPYLKALYNRCSRLVVQKIGSR